MKWRVLPGLEPERMKASLLDLLGWRVFNEFHPCVPLVCTSNIFQHLPTQSAGASDPAAGLWHPGLWRCQSPHGLGLQANSGLLPSLQWLHFWGVWGFTHDRCRTCSTVGPVGPVGPVGQRFDGLKRSVAQANDLCGCWEGLIDSVRWGQNALSIVMKCHEYSFFSEGVWVFGNIFGEVLQGWFFFKLNSGHAFKMLEILDAGLLLKPCAAEPFHPQGCCGRSQEGGSEGRRFWSAADQRQLQGNGPLHEHLATLCKPKSTGSSYRY